MIIQYDVLFKDYRKRILENFHGGTHSLETYRCSNPDCRSGSFYRHGTYKRYFMSMELSVLIKNICSDNPDLMFTSDEMCLQVFQVEILRLKCTGCGRTHAVLAADMIPFLCDSLFLVLTLLIRIALDNCNSLQNAVVRSHDVFSWQHLNYLLCIYRDYQQKMLAALRYAGLYAESSDPSDKDLLYIYLTPPFPPMSHLAFLRFNTAPLFVRRRSTVSYPLRYQWPENLFL